MDDRTKVVPQPSFPTGGSLMRAPKGMERQAKLRRLFPTIVRRSDHLLALLRADPYAAFRLSPTAKRIVTFLREPHAAAWSLPRRSCRP